MFGQTLNLALPSSKLPLVYRNPLQHLVSDLPYVDDEITDQQTKNQVERLIHQEMTTMAEQDYLSELPLPQTNPSDLIRFEMERIHNSIPMERTNFESKYIIESEPQTFEELQSALDLTCIKEQHQQINSVNLELLNKFGPLSWKKLLESQENEKQRLQNELTKARVIMNEINAQRKYEQLEVKQKIDQYKHQLGEMKYNIHELEQEIADQTLYINTQTKKKMKLID